MTKRIPDHALYFIQCRNKSDMLVSLTFNLWHEHFSQIKGNITLVLIRSGIVVNKHQLLCDAQTVLRPHQLYFYITHCRPFPLFLFCVCHSWQTFSWVPLLVVLTNYEGQQIVLWFPDKTSVVILSCGLLKTLELCFNVSALWG